MTLHKRLKPVDTVLSTVLQTRFIKYLEISAPVSLQSNVIVKFYYLKNYVIIWQERFMLLRLCIQDKSVLMFRKLHTCTEIYPVHFTCQSLVTFLTIKMPHSNSTGFIALLAAAAVVVEVNVRQNTTYQKSRGSCCLCTLLLAVLWNVNVVTTLN